MKISDAEKILNDLQPPITEEWLKDNDFKLVYSDEQRKDHRRKKITNAWIGANDGVWDLSLEVAPLRDESSRWYCWLIHHDPYRHIHIRYMETQQEIIDLIEAITGKDWDEQ